MNEQAFKRACVQEWERSPQLGAEFSSVESYAAYRAAVDRGLARIYAPGQAGSTAPVRDAVSVQTPAHGVLRTAHQPARDHGDRAAQLPPELRVRLPIRRY